MRSEQIVEGIERMSRIQNFAWESQSMVRGEKGDGDLLRAMSDYE